MIDDAVLTVDAAFPRIEAVKALKGFAILVRWEDGRENVVDLAPTIFSLRLYAPLRDDPSLLRSVHRVNPSVIAWGEDDTIDMHVSELERLAGEAMETADFNAFLEELDLGWAAAAALLGISRRTVGYYAEGHAIPRYIALACAHLVSRKRHAA